jgi:hypothetical protein
MLIHVRIVIQALVVGLVLVSPFAPPVHAVNFATAKLTDPGYKLKLYPFFFSADTRTDKECDPAANDLGLRKYGVMIGNFYQVGEVQLSAILPVGRLEIDKQNDNDTGIGDLVLRTSWNLPVEWLSIMPALAAKIPTGHYDVGHKVNLGDGQADLAAELYLYKLIQPFSFDALVKYNVRFLNPHSNLAPGNEFTAEGLITCRLADRIRIGPAVNFVMGEDNKKAGKTVASSAVRKLAVGGELWYGRFDLVKISLAGYRDLQTRNTNEGFTVMSRLAFEF